jgi:WD40 repeat protein
MDKDILRIWDSAVGLRHRISTRQGELNTLAFSADGSLIATGGRDGTIRVWSTDSGRRLHDCPGHRGAISSLSFSHENRLLISGSTDCSAIVWDLSKCPP